MRFAHPPRSDTRLWQLLSPGIVVLAAMAIPAYAQSSGVLLSVGRITTEKTCNLYQESEGTHRAAASRAAAANSDFAASREVSGEVDSWRTWLVKDCVNNFSSLKQSIQSALASSGRLRVMSGKSGRGGLLVDGRLFGLGGQSDNNTDSASYESNASRLTVEFDLSIRTLDGRLAYGELLTKAVDTSSSLSTDGVTVSQYASGQAVYAKLQRAVAVAVARFVVSKLAPVRVLAVNGNEIQLDCGPPLLALGDMVQINSQGQPSTRYTITEASGDVATGTLYGDQLALVRPGSVASIIEADDQAADARRFKKINLP